MPYFGHSRFQLNILKFAARPFWFTVSSTFVIMYLCIFAVNGEHVVEKNGGPPSLNLTAESNGTSYVIIEADGPEADALVIAEIPEPAVIKEEEIKEEKKSKEEKVNRFGKLFKKKAHPPAEVKSVPKEENSSQTKTDVSLPATDPQLVSTQVYFVS